MGSWDSLTAASRRAKVIVIATAEHLKTVDERLQASNVDVAMARSGDQYIALEAEAALARFIVA
jgi:N-acetylmuramoyl-L-alanine amidase